MEENQNQAAHIGATVEVVNKPKGKSPRAKARGQKPEGKTLSALHKEIADRVEAEAPPSKRGATLRRLDRGVVLAAMKAAQDKRPAALRQMFSSVSGGVAISEYMLSMEEPCSVREVQKMLDLSGNRRSVGVTTNHLTSTTHTGVLVKARVAAGRYLLTWLDPAGEVIRKRYAPKA